MSKELLNLDGIKMVRAALGTTIMICNTYVTNHILYNIYSDSDIPNCVDMIVITPAQLSFFYNSPGVDMVSLSKPL